MNQASAQSLKADRPERRLTIRAFLTDDRLNIIDSSSPGPIAAVPERLRPTLMRLIDQCRANPTASHVSTVSDARIVRVIAMAKPKTYMVVIERSMAYAKLKGAIDRYGISPRECDVLLLALEGKTAAETAAHLNIAVSTATDHLNRLLMKTGSRSKSELIAKVLGWQTPRDSEASK